MTIQCFCMIFFSISCDCVADAVVYSGAVDTAAERKFQFSVSCRWNVSRNSHFEVSRPFWLCHIFTQFLFCSWHQLKFRSCLHAPCGLRGCKNGTAPFPGRMSYKATKPGLVFVLYLSMFFIVLVFIRAPFYVLLVFIVCALSFGCSS